MDGSDNRRPIVVVLGMHRCGTSLTCNLLAELGLDLARERDVREVMWGISRNEHGFVPFAQFQAVEHAVVKPVGLSQVEALCPKWFQ